MTDKMNLSSFIRLFDTPTDAIDYILACNEKGLVEVSENTLPVYRFVNGRFIAYADWQPQTHSFDVRIQRWSVDAECSKDAVVRFDYTDGIDLYWNQLSHDLDGVTDESEMHWQDNTETHHRRERDALALQVVLHENRIQRTRTYLATNGLDLHPDEFDACCKRIADLRDLNDKAHVRIEELGY